MSTSRVLLIDDDASITDLLRLKLKALPKVEVEAVNDPAQALVVARLFQPHLIVCDIDLGTTDGGTVAQNLSASPALAAVPIVFLSSLLSPPKWSDARARWVGTR